MVSFTFEDYYACMLKHLGAIYISVISCKQANTLEHKESVLVTALLL